MARPDSISDIKREDRITLLATFKTDRILGEPSLLKHYTALLEATKKIGGEARKNYDTVDFYIPKNHQQLEDQLRNDQYYWDEHKKFYNLALNRGVGDDAVPEWKRSGIQEWARQEGLPDPFDVFAANDPELAQLRIELGMKEDGE